MIDSQNNTLNARKQRNVHDFLPGVVVVVVPIELAEAGEPGQHVVRVLVAVGGEIRCVAYERRVV